MKKVKATDGIASWKIDSPIERLLSRRADTSDFWKKIYVNYYKFFDKEYYMKGLSFIDKNIDMFIGEVSEEQRNEYICDMVYSLHRFGCMFDEYFLYGYPTLNAKGRESFITDKLRWGYYARMNLSENNEIFNDKKKAFDLFKDYYKRDLILIQGKEDKTAFCEFVSKHDCFIVKPYNSSGGRGVYKMDTNSHTINECFEKLLQEKDGVVCEELIKQSDAMSSFHPTSVNTVRFPTIRNKDGIHLFHPLLRTGVGGGIIDNASGGGIFALINPKRGIVYTEAKDEKGNTFLSHPDSGVIYPGFQIPDWEQAIELVNSLSMVMQEQHYVGWDLAHTDKGWIMVEGNPRGQIIMMQLFYRNGFKKEVDELIMNM